MQHVYEGKTKSVFKRDDGLYVLVLKDDVTGENGQIDPGANNIMGQLPGMGKASLKMSRYYFELLKQQGIKTHYVDSNIDENTMLVKPADTFGSGLEVICRFVAWGSFVRRYGKYCEAGKPLDALVEITLKDDDRGDPLITEEALDQLGILSPEEYKTLKESARKIAAIIKADLKSRQLELYDIKFEFGRADGEIILIDDISGGNMRVFDQNGKQVDPLELSALITQ
ncbi:MAG TPA: phosphoribosylaminoimidazolesuccinocarboxamide synthase [Syntrophomonadaceae bacterium]|jgi:phosphoribosylaminoimidazole-succinocarboxamide synthase|nr:phosphoribosylaminoimidazolesuccinocarboxamide synthase [Syntrophomonadaceae bacterium]HRX20721.1 phosphoribosylaminoimidazolesuccinocarboxamide synthase [Syntrophomonadaceae bacterium]